LKTETTNKLFENAKLVNSVTLVNDDKTEIPLKTVSHGLRKKTVFGLIPVDIYVLQVLASSPEKLVKDESKFLNSIKDAGPVQLHFTFLRDLPGEKISSSFKEGLEANGLDPKSLNTELATLLKEVSNIKEFKNGQNFALTFTWNGEMATVYITDPLARILSISGPKAFADQLLSIWFGKTADSRLEDLKKTLIK
ncbi:MAG: chalcone isomerase family protein, partial [Pseudobdellovibrio sp.]